MIPLRSHQNLEIFLAESFSQRVSDKKTLSLRNPLFVLLENKDHHLDRKETPAFYFKAFDFKSGRNTTESRQTYFSEGRKYLETARGGEGIKYA